jgi:hypothetical protein
MKLETKFTLPSLEELQFESVLSQLNFYKNGLGFYEDVNTWLHNQTKLVCEVMHIDNRSTNYNSPPALYFHRKIGGRELKLIALCEQHYGKEFLITCKYL